MINRMVVVEIVVSDDETCHGSCHHNDSGQYCTLFEEHLDEGARCDSCREKEVKSG